MKRTKKNMIQALIDHIEDELKLDIENGHDTKQDWADISDYLDSYKNQEVNTDYADTLADLNEDMYQEEMKLLMDAFFENDAHRALNQYLADYYGDLEAFENILKGKST